jgi:hypothetical protein
LFFLVKRNRIYYLHVKIPRGFTDILGSGDLSVSLGTGSKRKANKLAELANEGFRDRSVGQMPCREAGHSM